MKKSPIKTITALTLVGAFTFLLVAWNPSSSSFNSFQFGIQNPYVNIKSGVLLTNPVIKGTIADSTASTGTAGQVATSSGTGWGWSNAPAGGSAGFPLTVDGNAATFSVTNLSSVSGSNGAVIQFGGAPAGIASQLTRSDGTVLASIDTNGITKTNVIVDSSGGAKVQRIYNSRTNGFFNTINALDYGLSTTGDQTANLQAAINDATNSGYRVFIPAGTYTVNGTLIVKNCLLEGETPGSQSARGTILTAAAGANNIVFIPIGSGGTLIRNITFTSSSATGGATGITTSTNSATDTTNIRIEGCTFYQLTRAVYLNQANIIDINDCFVNDCFQGYWGTNNVNAVTIRGGHVYAVVGARVDSATCINWLAEGARFEQCSNAWRLNGLNTMTSIGCYYENNTNDFLANAVDSMALFNNEFGPTKSTNIVMVGCYFPLMQNNHFASAGPHYHIDGTTYGLVNVAPNYRGNTPNFIDSAITRQKLDGTNFVTTGGAYYGNGSGLTNVYETNLVQNILTPATATNTLPLYGGLWRLVVSGPGAITNLTGVTAGVYTYASYVLSNSLATPVTNWLNINAIAKGYDATNSAAALGINGYVVGAGKEVELLLTAEGINRTNWMLIRE